MEAFDWLWNGPAAFGAALVALVLAGAAGIAWRRERSRVAAASARADTLSAEIVRLSAEVERIQAVAERRLVELDQSRRDRAAAEAKAASLEEHQAQLFRDLDDTKRNPSLHTAVYLRQFVLELDEPRRRLDEAIASARRQFTEAVAATAGDRAMPQSDRDAALAERWREVLRLEERREAMDRDGERAGAIANDLSGNTFDADRWRREADAALNGARLAPAAPAYQAPGWPDFVSSARPFFPSAPASDDTAPPAPLSATVRQD